ncbi:MAG: hypothetical protein SXQ77_08535, partial [Halobacteria archaeon]|nr:hypothetical protein [Halobacteria archaeon]
MDIEQTLEKLADGEIGVDEALEEIEGFTRVSDFARIDTVREGRTGVPEAILSEGKTVEELVGIARETLDSNGHVIFTRIGDDEADELASRVDAKAEADRNDRARTLV